MEKRPPVRPTPLWEPARPQRVGDSPNSSSTQIDPATRGDVKGREAVSSIAMPLNLIEFPADDLARARRFWETLLDVSLDERKEEEGQGLQTHDDLPVLGLHVRGQGPGDRFSLPYFRVPNLARALERVVELEGSIVHPGERWAICRDTEGSPFGLAAE